jgi:protein-S-isoprenylcysteine O-methyltransferase Ste14
MSAIYKYTAYALITIVLFFISRRSLRAPGSHGFYRFFAWEIITALFLLNVEHWFLSPFAWYQLISWALLISSLIPLILGVRMLAARGKPVDQRTDEPQLFGFEKTSSLVTTGIYHYIRHPLYSSLLLLTWGIYFKAPGGWGVILALAATGFLVATARADENECIHYFGQTYRDYMIRTRMFIPFLF